MSLFGNLGNQSQQQNNAGGASLFGASLTNNNNQQKPSLFGNTNTNTAQSQQQTTSLFGSSFAQPQQQQQQPQQPQQQQQQQPNNAFGQSQQNTQQNQPQQGSVFGNLQNNANSFGASLLGGSTMLPPSHSQSRIGWNQSAMQPQRPYPYSMSISLQDSHTSFPEHKSIPDQMEVILRKWAPESPECLMQQYFYNSVAAEKAPFITMPADADERKWEEALRNKPSEGSVPVLAKGFQQLGMRLQMQVEAVRQLQLRLHEMNNSLGAMMQNHELVLSVRAAEAKRKHVGLSQRCLALAIKAQVLSSRGFVLSGEEEELKKKLASLEKGVFDPGFAGREEEIWARMVALRERSRWLQEESEKLGRAISGENGGLDEEVLKKAKKILSDYDAQLTHLRRELDQVKQEYTEWEAASKPSSQ
ncbi:hypothetical protein MBLNU459_g3571t1 [Dothideomycetes sp. NU459]